MEREVKITFKCGERTCASKPGVFCRFFGSIYFGSIPVCMLFPSEDGAYTKLFTNIDPKSEIYNWTERCQACLTTEKK